MKLTADRMRHTAEATLTALGSTAAEARLVAGHLVEANLRGHDSHGIGMLPFYVDSVARGTLHPNQPARLLNDQGAVLQFSGERGYGQRVAVEAMRAAIARARQTQVVLMTLSAAHHLGRIGHYGELAARLGFVSIHFVNVIDYDQPLVAPFGGTAPRFGTNPLCIALPGGVREPPFILDFATSMVAYGKTRVAYLAGRRFDTPVMLDAAGQPTADPIRRRARHRLIGASVLVGVAVLVLPWIFDVKPPTVSANVPIAIDGQSETPPVPSAQVAQAPVRATEPEPADETPAASERTPERDRSANDDTDADAPAAKPAPAAAEPATRAPETRQAAAADGNKNRMDVAGMLAQNFHANGALPRNDVRIVKGRDVNATAFLDEIKRVLPGIAERLARKHHLPAQTAHRVHLDGGRGYGHDDGGLATEATGRESHALGMVSG